MALRDWISPPEKSERPATTATSATERAPHPAFASQLQRSVATVATVAGGAREKSIGDGLSPAAQARRERVLQMLAESPGMKRAVIVDDESDPDRVIVAVAVRGLGTCDVCIARERFDPFLLLEIIGRFDGMRH
jgi:class 3 adenylate cyclase